MINFHSAFAKRIAFATVSSLTPRLQSGVMSAQATKLFQQLFALPLAEAVKTAYCVVKRNTWLKAGVNQKALVTGPL